MYRDGAAGRNRPSWAGSSVRTTLALVFAAIAARVSAQDLSVYGLFTPYNVLLDARGIQNVYASCFEGMGFETCVPNLPTDVVSYQALLPYYRDLGSYVGQSYCLACCGEPIDYIDTWDLSCEVDDSTRTAANVYGYELRLARNRFEGDTGVVTCPLRRSACTYSESGKTLSCDRSTDRTFLVGYTATIKVDQYSNMFRYWRGASECSIETIESPWPLNATQHFREKLIINHVPAKYPDYNDTSKLLFLLLFIYVVVYAALYFCRSKHCVYCQQKLVWSFSLCIKCRFVGAQPPDPVLLKMLEEKGSKLQGVEQRPAILPRCWKPPQWVMRLFCRRNKVYPDNSLYSQTYESKRGDEYSEMGSLEDGGSVTSGSHSVDKRREKRGKKAGWLKKKENPNLLPFEPEILGAAVGHHNFSRKMRTVPSKPH